MINQWNIISLLYPSGLINVSFVMYLLRLILLYVFFFLKNICYSNTLKKIVQLNLIIIYNFTGGTLIILFLQLTSHSFKNIHFTHKNNIPYLWVNVKLRKEKHGKHVSTEVVARRFSVKKVFLEISQNSPENAWAKGSFSIKLRLSAMPEQNIVVMPNWSILFQCVSSHSSIFVLEKQPEKLNFQSFFTSKKHIGG